MIPYVPVMAFAPFIETLCEREPVLYSQCDTLHKRTTTGIVVDMYKEQLVASMKRAIHGLKIALASVSADLDRAGHTTAIEDG